MVLFLYLSQKADGEIISASLVLVLTACHKFKSDKHTWFCSMMLYNASLCCATLRSWVAILTCFGCPLDLLWFFFFFGSQWILKNDFGVLESIGDSNPPMTIVTMLTDLLNRKSPMIADQQVYVHSHISRLHVWICACQECKFEPVCSVWVLRNRGDKVCDGKSMTQTLSLTLNEDFLVLYWVRELQSDVSWYAGLSHWSLWYDLL